MKKRILLCIMLVLLLPVTSQIFGFGNVYLINENRNRLEYPGKKIIFEEGYSAICNWYDDNFGFRDLLIRIQHQIDYSVFHYSGELFFSNIDGEEYLHYRSVIANEQIYNEQISDEKVSQILNAYTKIKDSLATRNVAFKFIIPPQKNEVLKESDEQMPVNRPQYNFYLRMQDTFLNSDLKDNYVDVLTPLKVANEDNPVFYHTDFHWNDYGAAVAFGEVINDYSRSLGMGDVYEVSSLNFRKIILGQNDAQMASLSVLNYRMPNDITCTKDDLEHFSNYVNDSDYPDYTVWENTVNHVFKDAVLIVGDSYTPPALYAFNETNNGIVELFPKVYFCHWDKAQGALLNIPDDVGLVVVEAIESSYSYMDEKVKVLLEE